MTPAGEAAGIESFVLRPIAHIRSPFREKFGIPRQAGLAPGIRAEIVFTPEYRNPEALRGLEGFDRLWLLWVFSASAAKQKSWSPTVRPPRLGGNTRMGVFATRSPYRPNPIGLSCVPLLGQKKTESDGIVLEVGGADLLDGTPILDIKPYVAYADAFPEAQSGFAPAAPAAGLQVTWGETGKDIPESLRAELTEVLSLDPRPAYQRDPQRIYGIQFGPWNVRFRVAEDVLTVLSVTEEP